MGQALTIIATSNKTVLAERRDLRIRAKALYDRSIEISSRMRKMGTLSSTDGVRSDHLTREVHAVARL